MKLSGPIKIILLLLIGIPAVWSIYSIASRNNSESGTIKQSATPMLINGLSYRIRNDGKLQAEISAEEFRVSPRRFFAFRIKSVNEAVLSGVKADIYVDENHAAKNSELIAPAFRVFRGKGKNLGLITRFIVRGIDLDIYRAGVMTHKLRAEGANVSLTKKKTIFYDAFLSNPSSGRVIRAKSIIWDENKKEFLIPGWYEAESPKGKAEARGIKVDLAFKVSLL